MMTNQTDEVASILRRCTLFSEIPEADLTVLAAHATRRKYPARTPIFRAGEPGQSMMGIVAGVVRITRSTSEGGEIILADLSAGDFFGEIALLDGLGRSADAMAFTNCEVVVLERRDFLPFMRHHVDCYDRLVGLLCGQIRISDERSADFLFLDLASRLAKTLLKLSASSTAGRDGKISHTQGELALIAGGTRSNVNRLLRKWERAGIIEQRKGWTIVKEPAALSVVATLEKGETM